ncbi:MAG TPA: hypothetical protein DCX17_00480, partial [Firmicutes bacterium]|nr:hypothetical protein [Bacillota bacterium]
MNERNHFEPVPQDKFHELILTLSLPAGTNESFLYQLHVDALQGVTQFLNEHPANPIRYINPVVLTLYLIHEHMYYYLKESEEKRAQLEQNQDYV